MAKRTADKAGATYADAGVSIAEGDAFAERLRAINPAIGGFSGGVPLSVGGMKRPFLVASTDGVGTKLLLARKLRRLDTIGIDLVAMVVNDLVVCGAKPLMFLDYYATSKLVAAEADAVVSGIVAGCAEAGSPLVGGETAEMPGLYRDGDFDLAGFAVGLVDRAAVVDGCRVRPGDVVLGLASSGVHSNGYSLVRAVVSNKRLDLAKEYDGLGEPLGDALLRPTRIYVKPILRLLKSIRPTAMAHITGGGLAGNLVRVLPDGARAVLDRASWTEPPVFRFLAERGGIDDAEMDRVFNRGVGYAVVVRRKDAASAKRILKRAGEAVFELGRIESGERGVAIA